MKNYQLFKWLQTSNRNAAKLGEFSGQTRRRHVDNTNSTRTRTVLLPFLCALMLLTFGVGEMWGRRVYVQPNQWNNDSYWVSIYAFGSSTSDPQFYTPTSYDATNSINYYDIDDSYTKIILVRQKPGQSAGFDDDKKERQTGDITLETSSYNFHNCYVFNNSWSDDGNTFLSQYYWEKNAYMYVDVSELDMTYGNWGSNVYMRIGHSSYCSAWNLKTDPNKVPHTTNLYRMTSASGFLNYTKIYIANAAGETGSSKNIYQTGTGITQQTEPIENSTYFEAYTVIPRKTGSYRGDDNIYYYKRDEYNYLKTYTLTPSITGSGTVRFSAPNDGAGTWHDFAVGDAAYTIPTGNIHIIVDPADGYELTSLVVNDGSDHTLTTDNGDGGYTFYYDNVRADFTANVTFTMIEDKKIYIYDSGNWNADGKLYLHAWNATMKTDNGSGDFGPEIKSLGNGWYEATISTAYTHFIISDGSNSHKTSDRTLADYNNGGCYQTSTGDLPAYTGDPTVAYVEVTKSGKTWTSNIVSAANEILSFFCPSSPTSVKLYYPSTSLQSVTLSTDFSSVQDNVITAKWNGSKSATALTDLAVYDGDYHIHCDATTANYLRDGEGRYGTTGTKFIYFEPNPTIFPGELFNYYWVDWFPEGESVIATIGNTYNDDLAGELGKDDFAPDGVTVKTDEVNTAEWGGNVRFGYNPKTNYFSRAIIAGSGNKIKIQGANVDPNKDGTYADEGSFSDASAWVYTRDAIIKGQATATITTTYNEAETLASDKKLMGGDSSEPYNVLITYDFKTNRLLAAWQPGESFEGFNLESNLMVVRTENGNPTVLNIVDKNGDGKVEHLSKITKIYTVLELLQDNWNSTASPYSARPYAKRRIVSGDYIDEYYWISLPYECLVKDIFGIEGYGNGDSYYDSWVLQTYRGDLRAEKGWWAETNAWWYDLERTDTLKANEGYVLRVTNLNGDNYFPKRFAGESGGKLYLYFPSSANDTTIGPLTGTVTTTLDSLKCTQWHKRPKSVDETEGANNPIYDRRAVDSNWRVIGSPSFNSTKVSDPLDEIITEDADTSGDGYISLAEQQAAIEKYLKAHPGATPYSLKYFYNWEVVYSAGEYTTKFIVANAKDEEFIGTHAHLVQYAGPITWLAYNGSNPLVGLVPNAAAAPARKNDNEQTLEQTLRLVLKKDGQEADVAYISRMLFGATTGYDVNMDLSKMTNANSANIYTYGELYKMAGNCLPDSVTTIQVGVQLATAGDYTFALPDGTNGTGVVLVDNVANTRTNLALTDYTVTLSEGETNERFWLELSPIAQNPTDLEEVHDDEAQTAKARKVMVDGILYIIRDNHIYDATGVILK